MILLRVLPEGLVKRLGSVLTGLPGVTSCSSFLRTLKIKCFSMKEKKVAGSWRHHGKCQSFHIISLTVLLSILYFPIAHNTLCLPPKWSGQSKYCLKSSIRGCFNWEVGLLDALFLITGEDI